MTTSSLDSIVRGILLRKGFPIHFYIDALIAARDTLRDISMDSLGIINTKIIELDDGFSATLPDDFTDDIECSVLVGQFLRPLVPVRNMNPLIHRDSSGNPAQWGDDNQTADANVFNSLAAGYFWRTITWNQYGENVGRLFGYNSGYTDTYQIFRERNQIQVNYQVGVTKIVLKYISDGMNVDAASHIETYAIPTIEAGILWQLKEMNKTYSEGEKERSRQLFNNEHAKLRARKAGWSIAKIKRIAQEASYSAGKA